MAKKPRPGDKERLAQARALAGLAEVPTGPRMMAELSDANLRAAVANAAAAVALYPQEKTAQALIRCMRAHVQCQREQTG